MNKHLKKAVGIVPATLLLAMAMPTSAHAVSQYQQDFTEGTDGWKGAISRVQSGTDGIVSSSGSAHAVLTEAGASTRFAGYTEQWDGAWSTSTDVYLDPTWEAETGFDYSVAVSGSDGAHLRDFIVHVAKDADTRQLLVGASSNTDFTVRTDLETRQHGVVDKAGWYTITHAFSIEDGHLAADIQLLDSDGDVVFTQHLANASDTLDKVGGNRYGWFTALNGTELAIDNVRVERVDNEVAASYSTNFDGVGITKDMTDRWHMSGQYDAGIVTKGGDARLRISNATTSGGFDGLYSPELSVAADETATNNVFNASFVIEPAEYQEGLRVTVNPDNGQGGREGTIAIKHEKDGTMTVESSDWFYDDKGELQYQYVEVASGLDISKAHTVNMQVVKKPDTSATNVNDVFRVWVDNGTQVETETYEPYNNDLGEPSSPTDALLFRLSGTAAPSVNGHGFEIDDLRMSVSTETPPVKPTPPTTKPPVKPVVKPKAKVKAKATSNKNYMHVNVNPNQGTGYWQFKVQKLTKDGWKTLPGTYKTYGQWETRTLNLPKGTYRTVVSPSHGHAAGVSNTVHLVK